MAHFLQQLTRIATITASELRPHRFFFTQNKGEKQRLKGCCIQSCESEVTSQDPFKYKLKTLRDLAEPFKKQEPVTVLPRYDELYQHSQTEINSPFKFVFKHHYDPMRLLLLLNEQLQQKNS